MSNHFRTAVLTVILAGGTLVSYGAAYATIAKPAPVAAIAGEQVRAAATAKRPASGWTDISVREACASFEGVGERTQCTQDIAGVSKPVRVIDFAGSGSSAARG